MGKNFLSCEIYYYPQKLEIGEKIIIENEEAAHILKVMRHKVGDKIKLTDGYGYEYEFLITNINIKREKLEGEVLNKKFLPREPNITITLASSPLKGENTEIMLAKTTELGISGFLPVYFQNTITKINENKLNRLKKIAISSLKTSAGTILPKIYNPLTFDELINLFPSFDLVLLAYENCETKLTNVVNKKAKNILLIIGPEGGFTVKEVKKAEEGGAKFFTLGKRRLRSETAGIVAVSLVLYEFNNI
ncbi:MAG: 16S rRNA (uracil(1498)-N(3))-methyltransferase [candidate division WOR-3 bacterium]|nr:16S rRNA (uracil(1498)-N(3))-methyltransferase [candidate division WOR-3 bacterium]MCX7837513.1 16S rRNA (uracil(1498)-N(3))-methyltransferase [candidate division WOR-3 bacterium]MDW8113385.1 RsmE family RNA methyltransferase [candidate division WOR-3 bacterium]